MLAATAPIVRAAWGGQALRAEPHPRFSWDFPHALRLASGAPKCGEHCWRSALLADPGGIAKVSTQELALVEEAVKIKLTPDSVDAWLVQPGEHHGHSGQDHLRSRGATCCPCSRPCWMFAYLVEDLERE